MSLNKQIKELVRTIKKLTDEQTKTEKLEAGAKKKWTAEYAKYATAAEDLARLKIHGTAKEANLKERVLGWKDLGTGLTKTRDAHRAKLKTISDKLITLGLELARLKEQQNGEIGVVDEIVANIFALNDVAVRAAQDREECLKRHVFPRLFGDDGKLLTQVTFTSSDGLRRIIAMVNTMTIVQGDLADRAKAEIEKFFEKFQKTKMDAVTQAMFELTKQILVEKTKFKVGPDLYRFLGMELSEKIFPELALAQKYLRLSIRSEKTNSYIRIFRRNSQSENWEPVPQS